MKVLWMPNNVAGVNFWRMYQFFRKMKERKVDTYIYNFNWHETTVGGWEFKFQQDEKMRKEIYNLIKYSDICIMQYVHAPLILALVEMAKGEFKRKMLAEIDDDVIETPEYNPAFKTGFNPGNFYEKIVIEHLKQSDGVITSTQYLKEIYSKFNNRIDVMPNAIDFKLWNLKRKQNKILRVGWVGGGNHDEDLRILVDVIPDILKRYNNVEFYFGHGVPDFLKNMGSRVKYNVGWTRIDKYPKFVADCRIDIGIAPLVVNRFNMAKSNLRFLEYSALKIPTIATDIEPFSKSIKNGETGFLCKDVEDWKNNLSTLIENSILRTQIGNNAFDYVYDRYNLEKITDRYINYLKKF